MRGSRTVALGSLVLLAFAFDGSILLRAGQQQGQGQMPSPFPLEAQLSDLGISSLKMVNLMLAVEVEFDIAIAQADITPENFHSLKSIENLVDRTLAQRA